MDNQQPIRTENTTKKTRGSINQGQCNGEGKTVLAEKMTLSTSVVRGAQIEHGTTPQATGQAEQGKRQKGKAGRQARQIN